ncbi:hypothetical protein [Nesterenkonia rhizosphaerae]|uniref:Uncharacterized protein n=1 Tax=Nesterenkonia rhizosphaerae TaxID=1348272 RepID=A0ABP9G1R3_9MICC
MSRHTALALAALVALGATACSSASAQTTEASPSPSQTILVEETYDDDYEKGTEAEELDQDETESSEVKDEDSADAEEEADVEEDDDADVVAILEFDELDEKLATMITDASTREPGYSGDTQTYYQIVLDNPALVDEHGNVNAAAFENHLGWISAVEAQRKAEREAAAAAAEQAQRAAQQAPTQQTQSQQAQKVPAPTNTGSQQSAPAPAPAPAPQASFSRQATESVARNVCGASVQWVDLGAYRLGEYQWGSTSMKINGYRQGMSQMHMNYVAAHECAHALQHRAFSGDFAAAQNRMNEIHGTSGTMGLEHNADCIAIALGYSPEPGRPGGYGCPAGGSAAAQSIISGQRP